MKTFLFLTGSLSFWLTELLLLMTTRLVQVRVEVLNWNSLSPARRRVLSLVVGLWMFIGFATMQRMRATQGMINGSWTFSNTDDFAFIYFPMGVVGILLILWWILGAVFQKWGALVWLFSFIIGCGLGVAAMYLDKLL